VISDDGAVWYTLTDFRRRLAETGRAEQPWMAAFLSELRRGRTVGVACDLAGVRRRTAYAYRTQSQAFRLAWDRARAEALIGQPLAA